VTSGEAAEDGDGGRVKRSSVEILDASAMHTSTVRRLIEAYNRVDADAITELAGADVVASVRFEGAEPLVLRGHGALVEAMASHRRGWQRDWIELEQIRSGADERELALAGRWRGLRAHTGSWSTLEIEGTCRLLDGRVSAADIALRRPTSARARPTRRIGGRSASR